REAIEAVVNPDPPTPAAIPALDRLLERGAEFSLVFGAGCRYCARCSIMAKRSSRARPRPFATIIAWSRREPRGTDRWFESGSLQRRVCCELGLLEATILTIYGTV